MNQKSWEKKNTLTKTEYICVCCQKNIMHHKNYDDTRFCESCYKMISNDYKSKCNNPDYEEQIEYFGYNTLEKFLDSVYEELRPLTYSEWCASQPI